MPNRVSAAVVLYNLWYDLSLRQIPAENTVDTGFPSLAYKLPPWLKTHQPMASRRAEGYTAAGTLCCDLEDVLCDG